MRSPNRGRTLQISLSESLAPFDFGHQAAFSFCKPLRSFQIWLRFVPIREFRQTIIEFILMALNVRPTAGYAEVVSEMEFSNVRSVFVLE